MAKRLNLARQTVVDRLRTLRLKEPKQSKQAKVSPAQGDTMRDDQDRAKVVEVLPGQVSLEDTNTPPADPVSAVADIVPVNDISVHLSPDEVQTLAHYERIIAQGIKTFVQVGHALLTIREQKLYRESYTTFEDYCRQRWDLSRPYAYQLIEASQVVDRVSAIADIVPRNEAQARPLTSLPPAQQVEVWREVVETAPPSGITARHVKEAVKRTRATPTGASAPNQHLSMAEETARRMTQRERPNHSWINVLSQAQRLSSSLWRSPERDAVFDSWGSEGRQKAIEYLRPLHKTAGNLLERLDAIEASTRE